MTLFIRLLFLYGPTVFTIAIALTACGTGKRDLRKGGLRAYGDVLNGQDPGQVASTDDSEERGDQDGQATGDRPGDGGTGDQSTTTTDPAIDVRSLAASAGIRNYAQINATMAVLTGVPETTAAVRTEYTSNLSASLPTDNDVRSFLGSQQVAVFKLAVEYCDALVKSQPLRTGFFGDFNFAATPAVALDGAGKARIAETLVGKLWGTGMDGLPAMSESKAMVVSVLDGIMTGKNLNQASLTPAIVTGACTAVLASAPITLF